MKKKIWIIRTVKILCLLLCVLLLSSLALDCCRYYDYNVNRMAGFYAEPKNTLDVVILGASEVFTGFSSGYAYDLYGFTSYSYAFDSAPGVLYEYQLREVLANQDPKWIIVEINGTLYDDPDVHTDGGRLRRFLNNMPYNWNRINAIMELVPAEEWYYHFYPLAKSHSNWKEFLYQYSDILDYYYIKRNGLVLKGLVTNITPFDAPPHIDVTDDHSTASLEPVSEKHLRSFLDYCKNNGIDNVMFVRFPHIISEDWSYGRFQRGNEAERIIVEEYGFPFVDLEQEGLAMGLDYTADFYNEDHVNIAGQIKITEYFGRILVEKYGVTESVLTEKHRLNWEQAAEYTRLFYRYCAECLEAGEVGGIVENRLVLKDLNEMKSS